MTRTTPMVAALLLVAAHAAAEDAGDALTRGKLEADLGHFQLAATAFASVADAPEASPQQRWEALVRLGVARREAGDAKGGVAAFEQAWREYGKDPDALRFLLQAVGSALPGKDRWDAVWARVVVDFDRSDPEKPEVRVRWPDAPPSLCPCSGTPVNLDFEAADLGDILRLMADVSGLNVVVQPGVQGKVWFTAHQMPWDLFLERALAPNGYIARRVGNVVSVGHLDDLSPKAAAHAAFSGKPIDFEFRNLELIDALGRVAAHGGVRVEAADGVGGRVTFKLVQVPWDQAFDLLARANGLEWTRTDDVIHVGPRTRSE